MTQNEQASQEGPLSYERVGRTVKNEAALNPLQERGLRSTSTDIVGEWLILTNLPVNGSLSCLRKGNQTP